MVVGAILRKQDQGVALSVYSGLSLGPHRTKEWARLKRPGRSHAIVSSPSPLTESYGAHQWMSLSFLSLSFKMEMEKTASRWLGESAKMTYGLACTHWLGLWSLIAQVFPPLWHYEFMTVTSSHRPFDMNSLRPGTLVCAPHTPSTWNDFLTPHL